MWLLIHYFLKRGRNMNQQLTQKEREIELVNALTIIARGSVSGGVMQMVASDALEKCGIEVPSHEIIND
jgi:hypothetical protein